MNINPTYYARLASAAPSLKENWDDAVWSPGAVAEITHFRPEGSSHRPRARARLLYDAAGLYGIFQVQDQFVRTVRARYMDEVWKDACVELFLQPKPDLGYINFEMNSGGCLVANHVVDPARTATGGLKDARPLPWELAKTIQIVPTLPQVVDPEIREPICWELKFHIPFGVFELYFGPLGEIRGQHWRGNFFKCAEDNSHPHWASWSPVDEFNFHLPRCFGGIVFE